MQIPLKYSDITYHGCYKIMRDALIALNSLVSGDFEWSLLECLSEYLFGFLLECLLMRLL